MYTCTVNLRDVKILLLEMIEYSLRMVEYKILPQYTISTNKCPSNVII